MEFIDKFYTTTYIILTNAVFSYGLSAGLKELIPKGIPRIYKIEEKYYLVNEGDKNMILLNLQIKNTKTMTFTDLIAKDNFPKTLDVFAYSYSRIPLPSIEKDESIEIVYTNYDKHKYFPNFLYENFFIYRGEAKINS
jgi:hypothetical protein